MPHEDADVSDLSAAQLARLRDALRGAAPPDNEPLPQSQFPDVQNTIAQTRSSADARGAASGPSAAERIGGYTLVRKLGEGGMGVVYLAQQENPRRDVALKVVRPGFLTPEFQRRFEYEAHVLGQLQHPGIAQIFEAGTAHTAAGPQPYFAMEYVRGELLLAYAARAGLNVRERLGLLVLICEAVQHAHQKGIVHRDLKPANILVTDSSLATDAQAGPDFAAADHRASSGLVRRSGLEGAAVQPKILDFGLARTLGADVQALTLHTSAGQLLGTLPYMSPEQTGGDPNAVDTRSDVYALGLVGYELLTGRLPYEVRGKPILEALRTIRDAEPLRPAAVDRSLRGDVETILLKALEKERSRRYPSASELAADIRRFLRDEPIAARPASAFYQLSKFARRHRALVFAAGAAAVALVLGLAATTWQMSRARQAEARATQRFEQVRKLARTFLFDVSDQVQALQGSRQTVEFIVRTAREYVEDLLAEAADDAELMNDLLGAMIRVGDLQGNPNQANLGDLQAALASYRQAADALERSGLHAGGDRRSVRQLSVAYSRIADVLEVQGEAAAAAEHRARSAALLEGLVAAYPDDSELLRDMAIEEQSWGIRERDTGQYDAARAHLARALELFQRRLRDAPRHVQARLDVALSEYNNAALEQATLPPEQRLERLNRARSMVEAILAEHPGRADAADLLASVHDFLGNTHAAMRRSGEALRSYEESLRLRRKLAAADPGDFRAQRALHVSLGKLSDTRVALADAEPDRKDAHLQAALEACREARTIAGALYACEPDNLEALACAAVGCDNLGDVHFALGNLVEAERSYREMLEFEERHLTRDPQRLSARFNRMVGIYKLGLCLGTEAEQLAGTPEAAAKWRAAREQFLRSRELAAALPEEHAGSALAELNAKLATCDEALRAAASQPASASAPAAGNGPR